MFPGPAGAHAISKALDDSTEANNAGRVRINLPAQGKADRDTQVDLPMHQLRLTAPIMNALGRDTRRHFREESKQRMWHRDRAGHLITRGEPVTDDQLQHALDVTPEE